MATDNRFYEMEDRDTPRMFAPSLRQAVAEGPEVLGLEAAVAALDLIGLEARYARVGHPAYPPGAMLKVLVYGYSLGLRASRQLERACKRDDAFRFLAGGLRPDHSSICRFRRRHAGQLPELFAQTVRLCQEAGRAVYARRKVIMEPVFGRLKHNWGFRRLLLRGRTGASIEWLLLCLGHNLRKWAQGVGLTSPLARALASLRRARSRLRYGAGLAYVGRHGRARRGHTPGSILARCVG